MEYVYERFRSRHRQILACSLALLLEDEGREVKEVKVDCGSIESKRKAKVVLIFPGVENGSQVLQSIAKNPGGLV